MINYQTALRIATDLNRDSAWYCHPEFKGHHIALDINNRMEVNIYKDDTVVICADKRRLDLPTLAHLNLLTPADLTINKIGTRKFQLSNGHLITDETQIFISPDQTWKTANTYDPAVHEDAKKAVHKKTRALRRTLLPKLRLLGPEHFAEVPTLPRWGPTNNEEDVTVLLKILEGDHSLPRLQQFYKLNSRTCEKLRTAFGRGNYQWGANMCDVTPETWSPNEIINQLLLHTRRHKIAILEAYNVKHKSRSASQSKS